MQEIAKNNITVKTNTDFPELSTNNSFNSKINFKLILLMVLKIQKKLLKMKLVKIMI